MHASLVDSEVKQPAPEAESAEARLVRELTSQAPPAARTPKEWERLYAEFLRTLLSATTYPDAASPDRPRPPKMILEEIIVAAGAPGREAQRAALVRAMVALLQSSDRLNDRIFLLRQLAVVGREEVVPPLARLLTEKAAAPPALWQYALGALESNTSPAAGPALVAALEQAGEPAWRVAVIQSLGRRQEKSAAGPLARDLDNRDAQVAATAAMSLGSIATPEAAQALASTAKTAPEARRAVLAHARLLCADRMAARGEKDAAYTIFKELHDATQDPLLKTSAQRGMTLSKPR
jgi:hypothetical protein